MNSDQKFADSWLKKEKHIWCLHCNTVNLRTSWVEAGGCPEKDCDGSPIDGWNWKSVLENNSNLPKTPTVGKKYDLYKGQ